MKNPLTIAVDKDIVDLAETFLRNRRNQTQEWRQALDSRDLDALRRVGHEIKGTAGAFGFGDLSTMGAALEQSVLDDDPECAGRMLDEMAEFLDRVTVVPR